MRQRGSAPRLLPVCCLLAAGCWLWAAGSSSGNKAACLWSSKALEGQRWWFRRAAWMACALAAVLRLFAA